MHIFLVQSMYGGEVEDLRVDVSSSERQYLPPSVRLHLTPLQTYSEKLPESHIMCIIRLDTNNEYPHRLVLRMLLFQKAAATD